MSLRTLLVAVLIACPIVAAQAADQPLASWEFNRDGDAEKWYPAHSLAPFEVAGGILKTHATAGDPYMIASEGDAFDLTANDFQYVEIRLKSDKDGYGEFFWASTVEGKDAGFVGGKERGFGVRGDGQFHIYRVFPIWQGRVTRLRFDPPDDANLEIDYIRVMQTPPSTHEATSPRWDFAKDGAGGFIPTSGCTYDAQAGGLKVTMDNENAILTSSVLDLSAADYACVTLHFTASAPMQIMLNWSDTTDGNFPGSNVIPVDLSAGEDYVTLHFSDVAAWAGAIKRIAIGVAAKPDDTLTLQSLAFAKQPEGPAKLTVISLSGERSIYATGDKARLVLKVRNDGGETARNVRATLNGADAISLPDLGPGLTAEASWTLAAAKPGLLPVSVKLEADNAFRAAQAATELIVTEPMPELTATGGKPFAAVRGAGAILGNDKLQLTFAGDPSGFRSARVDLRDGSRTRTMGFLPHLASLAVGDDAAPVSMTLKVVNSKSSATGASLSMKGTRGPVTVEVTYSVKPGQTWVDIAYRVTSSKPVAIRSFQGPWLWAGEGSFADQQDHAIFPGVEWLVKGERSSTSLDISPPMHVRWAPHPNWITIPSMAIEQDGAIVGLMWDPLQKWDGKLIRPAAAFASPNFVEMRRNHLLGLFLPSIPDYVKANSLLAKKAYDLQPGKALTLQASLYAEPRTDITRASTLWYDRFCGKVGAAPSLPAKPRDYTATIDMCMRAYEKVLWAGETKGWMPVMGWAPARDIGIANLYYAAAQVRAGTPDAAAWWARALDVGAGSGDITFALRGHGNTDAALRAIAAGGESAAASQPADARYAFHPDAQRQALGPDGGIAVGIAAGPTEGLLRAALATGDKQALEAGLRGLAFMDQFDVPRASQVWECPLHSPDILASGQACRAYLLGYRLTGEEKYLRRAIFWARTGLPFVYAWQAPEMPPMMKYATIPIFGATFYTGSWFGVPVQWNGLDYAYACLELARYDKSFPWAQIGEGITIAGMNMQSTRAKDYGCYTDNWNVVTNTECVGCMLSPGGILANVFRITRKPSSAGADGVVTPTGWIAVNGPAEVSGATLKGDVLTARASYLPGESGVVAILPVTKPASVSVDGKALEFLAKGEPAVGQWTYNAGLNCVSAKLKFGAQPATIALSGVRRAEPKAGATEWTFNTPDDPLGWTPAHDLGEPTVEGGILKMSITGTDPYCFSPFFAVPAEKASGFALSIRCTKPGGQIFWATDVGGGFAPERSANFDFPADGQFHEVTIDLTGNPEWRGNVQGLRVDFNDGPGGTAELQWAKVVRK